MNELKEEDKKLAEQKAEQIQNLIGNLEKAGFAPVVMNDATIEMMKKFYNKGRAVGFILGSIVTPIVLYILIKFI